MPALAALALLGGLSSCKDDTQPRLQTPAPGTFKVYEPALNNYTYILDPESTIELVTSQPEYGLGTVTQYQVQVCLSDKFQEAVEKDGVVVTPANYEILPTVNTQAKISVSCKELCVAMNTLHGILTEEDKEKYETTPAISGVQPVYIRVNAYVADPKTETGYAPGSQIYSNVVTINKVQPYFAVNVPKIIYLIGNPQGWDVNVGTWPLSEAENGIGSDIYTASFDLTQDDLGGGGFRFYNALGDWGKDGQLPSIGAAANDGDNIEIAMDPETQTASAAVVAGKGNFVLTGWNGGWMKMTVNLVNMTASFGPGEAPAE